MSDRNMEDMYEQGEIAKTFTSNSLSIKTVTLDQIDNQVTLEELRPETKNRLQAANVLELFPVQQAVYSLFLEGRELIVK